MNKKIENIVFYKFNGENGEMEQACIFYADGTVKNTSVEEGYEAVSQKNRDEHLTRDEFINRVNKQGVFTLPASEFERRFSEFLGKGEQNVNTSAVAPNSTGQYNLRPNGVVPTSTDTTYNMRSGERTNVRPNEPVRRIVPTPADTTYNRRGGERTNVRPNEPVRRVVPTPADTTYNGRSGERTNIRPNEPVRRVVPTPTATSYSRKGGERTNVRMPETGRTTYVPPFVNPSNNTNNRPPVAAEATEGAAAKDGTTVKVKAKPKKKSFWQRIKETKVGKRLTSLLVAAGILVGGIGGWLLKGTKAGNIISNNIGLVSEHDNKYKGVAEQDIPYLRLIDSTSEQKLRTIMTNQGKNLDAFNKVFANAHLEEGKNIKAALTWDEMMALNLAYNDYSKDEIRMMFNGSEVNSDAMTNAYKNATLQLMCSYVISDRQHPVNSSQIVNSKEGRAFVEKYNDLFLKCKEATGDAQVNAIDAFYAELHKDFPITDDVRAIGISHAEDRDMLKPYMLAVVPIVGASEMMFQNIDGIDHTLSDKAIDYFNDLGLCNQATERFERAETITLTSETDKSLPLYSDFRKAKIAELISEGNYVTSDENRDLSQLDEFQKWVNGFYKDMYTTYTVVSTHTETNSYTVTTEKETDDRNEAVDAVGEEAVKKAEEEADEEVRSENEEAKKKGEEEAEEKRQELQDEADREKDKLEQEVKKDDQDLQDKINDANNSDGAVNEGDFGDHNVTFDPEDSDDRGNLNDSVTDITTDGNGAVDEGSPLPDPNETGAKFDAAANSVSSYNARVVDAPTMPTESSIYEHEEAYEPAAMSNEELVEAYVASLDGVGEDESTYGFSK